mgnify:CR=1 FL=1
MHLAQFHPVHSVHSEGEIFVLLTMLRAYARATTLARLCHRSGTTVTCLWHNCANRVAQAWHYIGCSKGAAERDLM